MRTPAAIALISKLVGICDLEQLDRQGPQGRLAMLRSMNGMPEVRIP